MLFSFTIRSLDPQPWGDQHGAINRDEVTLSLKGAKSPTRGRKLRSIGTKARPRISRGRNALDLERQLEVRTRELADAREDFAEVLEQQTATSEVLRVISSSPTDVWPHVRNIAQEQALKPGDSFRECAKDCPEMVVVPPGSFAMGSPATEKGRDPNEGPQHSVTIANPFAVSRFEVTWDEWDVCVKYGDCPQVEDSGFGRGTKPVINVSWDDARQYATWFSKVTDRPYRLLTEAEWEYAARAGSTTAYFWGDEIGEGNANCGGCGSQWDKRQTSPVDSFKPNAFGLHDMAGNVWQWVQDCYHGDYNGAPTDGSAWTSGDCNMRGIRGGSWFWQPEGLRSAARQRNATGARNYHFGIRLGRTLSPLIFTSLLLARSLPPIAIYEYTP